MYKFVTFKYQVTYTDGKVEVNEGQLLVKENIKESLEHSKKIFLDHYKGPKIKEVKILN